MLAGALRDAGHAVRGTTRDPLRLSEIEAAGAEAMLADPDRVATLIGGFAHVTVVCILLGSATGPSAQVRALHGPRLEMLLTKLVDTTARGVVYESRGSVQQDVLDGGAERVRSYARRSMARYALLGADPADPQSWLVGAVRAVDEVVGEPR